MTRLVACIAILLCASTPVLAQDALADMLEVFNGEGDSLTNIFLGRVFGCRLFPGIPDCDNLPRPAFAAVIGLFNVFCMALGMALFAWNATVGTMQTAHEGKVFGGNWSSLWAPIRTIAAVAMFTPLPAIDNYNTVQLSVSWLVRGSTASASIVWSRASTLILNHQAPVTAPEMVFDQEVLRAAWQLVACQAVIRKTVNDYVGGAGSAGRIALAPDYRENGGRGVPVQLISPDDQMLVNSSPPAPGRQFGTLKSGDGGDYPFEICGTISLPEPPAVVLTAGQGDRWYLAQHDAVRAVLNTLRPVAARLLDEATTRPGEDSRETPNAAAAILAAGERFHGILSRELPGIARDSAIPLGGTGQLSGLARERIDLLVAGAYSETCTNRAERPADDPLQWICSEGGAGQGWLGAGAWYMHMARFANEANALFHARPEASDSPDFQAMLKRAGRTADQLAGNNRLFSLIFGDASRSSVFAQAARSENLLDQQWNAAVIHAAALGSRIDGRLIEGAFESEGLGPHVQGWWDAPRRWMTRKARDWFLPPATVDPMASLAEFGNAQLVWGLGLTGAGKVVQSGYLNFLPANDITEDLGKVAVIIGVALMTSGAFLAFILPLLPFLLWTAAVTGYFILVAEAIIAVNLWAVAHLRMDGHSFAGEAARQGYYLVLALTLSPILMVFGFILGMAIFKVTAALVGIGFDVAVQGIAHDQSWLVWLVGMAVIGIIMVIVYVVLAERSFSLTAELPTRILRWVGASAELSSKEDDRIRAGALAAAGALTAASREIIQSGPGRAGSRRRAGRRPAGGETGE